MCQMPNIWHIWHTKHKNRALLDVPNLKNYATLLQYRLKYKTVRTAMAKWDIIILLHFSLSSSIDISLRQLYLISSLSVTLYLFPLLLAQESCSRSLSSPRHDLAASYSSPRRPHPQPSPLTFRYLLRGL